MSVYVVLHQGNRTIILACLLPSRSNICDPLISSIFLCLDVQYFTSRLSPAFLFPISFKAI